MANARFDSTLSAENVTFQRTILERVEIALSHRMSKPYLYDMRVNVRDTYDMIADMMVMELRGFLLGEQVTEVRCDVPASWWDHTKRRWFPAWALKRWPAHYTTHVLSTKAVYPDFKPAVPNERYVYVVSRS